MRKIHLIAAILLVIMFASCNKEDYSTIILQSQGENSGNIHNNETQTDSDLQNADLIPISESFPRTILNELRDIMPIYDGNNPPDIQGTYKCSPLAIYYSNVEGDMEYYEQFNFTFADKYFSFYEQDRTTSKYKESQTGVLSHTELVSVTGSENNFTAYFIIDATTTEAGFTATSRQAMVVSGTKVSSGIENYKYALVMLAKNDPNEILAPIGRTRAYKDGNELAANTSWLSKNSNSCSAK